MKNTFLVWTVILLAQSTGYSQGPDAYISTFFNLYAKQGLEQGIDYLYETNPWLNENEKEKNQLKASCKEILNEGEVGQYRGKEVILRKRVGRSLMYMSYLIKYERQPYRMNFIFYKPHKSWQLHELSLDSEIEGEIIETGKIFMLPPDEF